MLDPLRRRGLRGLVGAQFLSETADGVVTVALPLYVLAETGSAAAMSLAFAGQMLGGAVFAVVGGILADRANRQAVLVVSFLARAGLLLAAWIAAPVGATVALGIAARMLGQMDNPSFDALIPQHADGDLQQVLSLRRFIQSVSIIVGPGVGALAVWGIGEKQTLLAAAVPFVLAALIHLRLPGLDRTVAARRREREGHSWREFLNGLGVVARTPFVRRLALYWMLQTAAVALALAAAAVWFEQVLDAPSYWYGLSVSAYGTGAALATLGFGGRRFTWPLARILVAAAPVYTFGCVLGVVAEVPWLMSVGWLIWGVAFGPEIVRAEPEFVSRIDESNLGRAYAGLGVALTLGSAIGYLLAGPLLETVGARSTTFATGALILATAGLWIGPARRPTHGSRSGIGRSSDHERTENAAAG